MKNINILLTAILVSLLLSCKHETKPTKERLTAFVNPFMGTDGPGNTYPGATVPFGMIQLSPDHGIGGWDRIAGYFYPDTIITGFSHMHLTGTGAGDLYDILISPINSKATKTLKENGNRPYSTFSHDNEQAEPGYYQVYLQDYGINAELTTTKRTGIHQYTFTEDQNSGIIIDLGYALNWDAPVDTYLKIVDNTTIEGYRFSTGWAKDQRVFFTAKFSKPFESTELFANNEAVNAPSVKDKNTKVIVKFSTKDKEKVLVKVGFSSASNNSSKNSLMAEAKHNDFNKYRQDASDVWENELSKITIETDNITHKKTFYTTLYQSMLAPTLLSDTDSNYKGADGDYHQAKGYDKYDTFSLWDTFRAAHPLYTIMHPERAKDFVSSMISHYEQTGLSPVWSMQGNETDMMIGYHAVPVIVDAYFKGLLNDFDAELLYEACKSNAMDDSHGIKEYRELGYVPVSFDHENWSVSKTVEYAYDDWCIAQLAKALNKTDEYNYFMKRANNWQNHYDTESSFLRPKKADGQFLEGFVAKDYTDHFCESNAWHYFWFVPHNIEGLINKTGGYQRFEEKLDSMFTYHPKDDDELPIFSTGMIGQYAHGNEPSHHVAYLYNYLGKPWKTQERVREILETQYAPIPNGHCGNEDCGQMSSWYIFSSMGFYPVNPADGIYVIGTPLWNKASIKVDDGKLFEITAHNASESNKHIASVKLNGKLLNRSYIYHHEIMQGGHLEFEMTNAENLELWTEKEAFPPSNP
ncbi:GH92 family glycosyl hydrolase [Carboxylicivirga sp. A043]|uniref:GH92 family glycosyl hydrolase n=1 Tax=Carboxylicivirga litoralis TaxID=2816963 RepID=UPI0021CB6EFC|nr:GH92 family glycosyl hydrolase [Carboxylicivirga sp. A043]MCU4155091.1 GH92 family glycosyl hydrolase [Carboxylicivirga sp. A043]